MNPSEELYLVLSVSLAQVWGSEVPLLQIMSSIFGVLVWKYIYKKLGAGAHLGHAKLKYFINTSKNPDSWQIYKCRNSENKIKDDTTHNQEQVTPTSSLHVWCFINWLAGHGHAHSRTDGANINDRSPLAAYFAGDFSNPTKHKKYFLDINLK